MYIGKENCTYFGDMQQGDREATLDPAFSPGFKKMWDFNQKTIELRKKL